MLSSANKRYLFTIYFSIIRPCFVVAQANMTSSGALVPALPEVEAGEYLQYKYSVAYVTGPNKEWGVTLARGLVKNKLAACVNLIPEVISIYEWKDEINEDSEVLLMIKTRTSQVDKLTQYVRSNHPYEVCEVISLPIKNGNPPYLKWIGDTVPEKN